MTKLACHSCRDAQESSAKEDFYWRWYTSLQLDPRFLARLMGSTTSALVHKARCDVVVVRLPQ